MKLIEKVSSFKNKPSDKRRQYAYEVTDGVASIYLATSDFKKLIKQYKLLAKSRKVLK